MNSSGFALRRVREEMIEKLLELGIKDFRVLDAISQVPRHIFVDEALRSRAYENRSLTIGYQQTISQPYIVARMTELLISHTKSRGKVLDKVLELGSGCGYQSAVLSYFCEKVDAIERIKPLVQKARDNLAELKIHNVQFKYGDGYIDYDKSVKYDGILCAAAPRSYPEDLISVLKNNAKLVLPVGGNSQKLNVITKKHDDNSSTYISDTIASARWLKRSVEQRNSTTLTIASAIVAQQEEFLEKGLSHLKPMVLRDIASNVGMHESTVSRVTTGLTIETPRGCFAMKYFFSVSLNSADNNETHAATAVRETIKKLISEEPSKKPLSDEAIATIMKKDGIDLARRTVAKYREIMKIPSSAQRKRQSRLAEIS